MCSVFFKHIYFWFYVGAIEYLASVQRIQKFPNPSVRQWHMPGYPSTGTGGSSGVQIRVSNCSPVSRQMASIIANILHTFCTQSCVFLLGTPGLSVAAAKWCAQRPAKIICNNIYCLWKYHVIIVTVDPRPRWLFLLILWLFWKIELWNFWEK